MASGVAVENELQAVSLFAGAGGLDLGFEAAGIRSLIASDVDPFSCATLQGGKLEAKRRRLDLMRSSQILEADVADLNRRKLVDLDSRLREIDVLIGGPPCQAFSVFGKRRGLADPRGQLLDQYLRLLSELRPRAFVLENVFGLLSVDRGSVFADLCDRLSSPRRGLQYELSVHRLNAADFGVPQFRDRVFLIGHADGEKVRNIDPLARPADSILFPDLPVHRTVRDGLRGLPPMGSAFPANHTGRKHSGRIVARYASLRPGERDHHTRINRLDLDRPSYAIIVGSDKGGGKGHVHPTEPREVTPRESARMQSFPDWWAFTGRGRHPIRQIGNAVPPLLGAAVANEIRSQLFGLPRVSFSRVLSRLGQGHLFE